jgi:plasmid stabilization system protein ParE
MTRVIEVDEEAAEEAEAQVRYYSERAGTQVALRFVAELEAIYVGLVEGRFVGVNHPRVGFRLPVKRVFLDRFPFAVVFYLDVAADTVHVIALEALRKRPGHWRSRLRVR